MIEMDEINISINLESLDQREEEAKERLKNSNYKKKT